MADAKGSPPAVKYLTAGEVRRLLAESILPEQLKRGDLAETVKKREHFDPPPAQEPLCTWSEMVEWKDRMGARIALLHRYLRPDGKIGASGKPDPKELRLGGVTYRVRAPD